MATINCLTVASLIVKDAPVRVEFDFGLQDATDSQGDGRDGHSTGVGVERGKHRERAALQHVDDDVGVEQTAQL